MDSDSEDYLDFEDEVASSCTKSDIMCLLVVMGAFFVALNFGPIFWFFAPQATVQGTITDRHPGLKRNRVSISYEYGGKKYKMESEIQADDFDRSEVGDKVQVVVAAFWPTAAKSQISSSRARTKLIYSVLVIVVIASGFAYFAMKSSRFNKESTEDGDFEMDLNELDEWGPDFIPMSTFKKGMGITVVFTIGLGLVGVKIQQHFKGEVLPAFSSKEFYSAALAGVPFAVALVGVWTMFLWRRRKTDRKFLQPMFTATLANGFLALVIGFNIVTVLNIRMDKGTPETHRIKVTKQLAGDYCRVSGLPPNFGDRIKLVGADMKAFRNGKSDWELTISMGGLGLVRVHELTPIDLVDLE